MNPADPDTQRPTQAGAKKKHDLRGWIIGGVIALLVTAGIVGYHEVLDPLYLSDNWGTVEEGMIYRSGDPPPYAVDNILRDYGIDQIIKLSGHVPSQLHHRKEAEAAEAVGAEMLTVPMPGNGCGTVEAYVRALSLMRDARTKGRPTLLHCAAGTNRTGGVVAAYRLLFEDADPDAVLEEMLAYDYSPAGNPELLKHLNTHMPEMARRLAERGYDVADPNAIPRLAPKTASH